MGGKTWSAEEERYFWLEIIPQSPSAVRLKDRLQTWDACAGLMQRAMGEPRRRDYTKTMLCASIPIDLLESLQLTECVSIFR